MITGISVIPRISVVTVVTGVAAITWIFATSVTVGTVVPLVTWARVTYAVTIVAGTAILTAGIPIVGIIVIARRRNFWR